MKPPLLPVSVEELLPSQVWRLRANCTLDVSGALVFAEEAAAANLGVDLWMNFMPRFLAVDWDATSSWVVMTGDMRVWPSLALRTPVAQPPYLVRRFISLLSDAQSELTWEMAERQSVAVLGCSTSTRTRLLVTGAFSERSAFALLTYLVRSYRVFSPYVQSVAGTSESGRVAATIQNKGPVTPGIVQMLEHWATAWWVVDAVAEVSSQ